MSDAVLSNEWPTARKDHRCDICDGTVGSGDRYLRQRGIFDGYPYTFKAHALCVAADRKVRRNLDLLWDESPDPSEVKAVVESVLAALCVPLYRQVTEDEEDQQ